MQTVETGLPARQFQGPAGGCGWGRLAVFACVVARVSVVWLDCRDMGARAQTAQLVHVLQSTTSGVQGHAGRAAAEQAVAWTPNTPSTYHKADTHLTC